VQALKSLPPLKLMIAQSFPKPSITHMPSGPLAATVCVASGQDQIRLQPVRSYGPLAFC
jgi:hypothetical protein